MRDANIASVTVFEANKLTQQDLADLAAWMREQGDFFAQAQHLPKTMIHTLRRKDANDER
jgi:hypothetical protein